MCETLEYARLILRVCGYWPILSRSCKNTILNVTLGSPHQDHAKATDRMSAIKWSASVSLRYPSKINARGETDRVFSSNTRPSTRNLRTCPT